MSLLAALKGRGPNGFGYGSTTEQVTAGLDLSGSTYLLTGCNSGLGLETLRVLALRGAHVIAAARSEASARAALAQVGHAGTPLACDLAEAALVRACAQAVAETGRPLAAIVCNAGIMALPRRQERHGIELQLLTNHIGHFILVTALLDQLAPQGRVVVVSSSAHRAAPREGIEFDNLDGARGYRPWRAYGQSKLANILFARELARRLGGPGGSGGTAGTANACHPGVVKTQLGRHMGPLTQVGFAIANPLVLKSVTQGAATQIFLAAHPTAAATSGAYFEDCNPARPSPQAHDDALAARLWGVSEEIAARLP